MNDELTCPVDRSLCKHCVHKITREISSEGMILTTEDGDVCEDLGSFIHDACILLSIDLDHIVLDCNKFILDNTTYDGNREFITNSDILKKVHK